MIIIRKKRLITLCLLMIICTSIAVISTKPQQQTIQTMSLPVTNKIIVIDAGHGIPEKRSCLLALIK